LAWDVDRYNAPPSVEESFGVPALAGLPDSTLVMRADRLGWRVAIE
jgi:hypothetical protein